MAPNKDGRGRDKKEEKKTFSEGIEHTCYGFWEEAKKEGMYPKRICHGLHVIKITTTEKGYNPDINQLDSDYESYGTKGMRIIIKQTIRDENSAQENQQQLADPSRRLNQQQQQQRQQNIARSTENKNNKNKDDELKVFMDRLKKISLLVDNKKNKILSRYKESNTPIRDAVTDCKIMASSTFNRVFNISVRIAVNMRPMDRLTNFCESVSSWFVGKGK